MQNGDCSVLKSAENPLEIGMGILVVGSVAFDSIKSPFGSKEEVLGGSATYFSIAASYFTDVSIVAVVGDDFPKNTRLIPPKGNRPLRFGTRLERLQVERGIWARFQYPHHFGNTAECLCRLFSEAADLPSFQGLPFSGKHHRPAALCS